MNHVNFDVEKEAYKVVVCVEVVEQKDYPLVPIVTVTTKDVERYLQANGFKVGPLIKEDTAHNKRNNSRHGTWVFKKVLDNSPEPVILKEEKPVLPKTSPKPKAKATRKKHTRSSTKKVSTEE